MPQAVGYFDDNVIFTEGPFVHLNPLVNGWRVECEVRPPDRKPQCNCVLPDLTVYEALEEAGFESAKLPWQEREKSAARVDWLNAEVRKGRCVLHENGYWYFKGYDKMPSVEGGSDDE